jgi:trans-aconitate methyltransferase
MTRQRTPEHRQFDDHAGSYEGDLDASMPQLFAESDYFARYKVDVVAARCRNRSPEAILDYGCGVGLTLQKFAVRFPGSSLWGFDVSSLSIDRASRRMPQAKLNDPRQSRGLIHGAPQRRW